jgi:hypothetical protein
LAAAQSHHLVATQSTRLHLAGLWLVLLHQSVTLWLQAVAARLVLAAVLLAAAVAAALAAI